MKNFLILTMLLAVCGMTYAQGANAYHEVGIVDENNNRLVAADVISVRVLIAGTNTNATIYTTKSNSTAITQPITTSSSNTTLSGNSVYWWGANLYDIVIVTEGGNQVIRRGNNNSIGTVVIQAGKTAKPRNVFITFKTQPVASAVTGAAAVGTDTAVNVMVVDGGYIMEYNNITTQTILVPQLAATGLNIDRDVDADNGGSEYTFGVLANSPYAFVVGTDPAFFIRGKYTISTDADGSDAFLTGFRKAQAYAPDYEDYDDMAAFNNANGRIDIETIIGDATTVVTDTTETDWADGETHTFQVNVSAAGVVTYLYDGVTPTVTVAYTFTDGLSLIPFVHLRHDTAYQDGTTMLELEIGLQ